VEDWNWETMFADIIGLYSTTVMYLASKAIKFGEKMQNKGYYVRVECNEARSSDVGVIAISMQHHTNGKSHMSFRLVPNSVTLDDLERRNSPNRCVISPNSVAFGADYVKVVEDTPVLTAAEM